MVKPELIVASDPPASRAPVVIARLRAVQRELADLKLQIPERVLACAEGKPGARESLVELHRQMSIAAFEIESHAAARELAVRLDQEATVAWKAAVQILPPEEIIAGITKEVCCKRCIPGIACAITGSDALAGPCAHPVLVGALELTRYVDNPKIQAIYAAACRKLGLMRLHA